MKFEADTISIMPRVESAISTGSSKRTRFSSSKKLCAIIVHVAAASRISALAKRENPSVTNAPWNAVASGAVSTK